ncbi:MAG: NPCBM/NEW2 domain-containing protein, partial [Saprospiraceae bacterium]|nr:NPCBM/NEW2 domain-containing protein [Saprospiraceae bacterium]
MTSTYLRRFRSKTIKLLTIFSFLLFAAAISPFLPAPGINAPSSIGAYLDEIFPTEAPGGGSGNWEVEVVYPNLTFTDPLSMLELPDQSGYYIAGKPGYIWKISDDNNTNQKTTVLDFSDVVDTDGDSGLMNAILHPEFGQAGSPNRGYLYVLYRYHPNGNLPGCGDDAMIRLSRFNKPDGQENFDRNSEYVHIQIFDTHCWHNGGGMFFDNEDYMFITIGDAGGANDQFNTAQQIDQTLLGGLLRIDLTGNTSRSHPIRRQPIDPDNKPASLPDSYTQGYLIPNDNPWLDSDGGILEEFYSLGLRSPHRATYDAQTGDIWIGDVGQGAREEISVAVKGGNFQWPYKEGSVNGPKNKPSPLIGTDQPPIFDYGRSVGNSVIGGFVYRGSKFANSLGGKYLFGDHGVRNIWSLNPNNGEVVFIANIPAFGVGSKSGISSFHTDSNGEVYILKLFGTDQDGGKIYRLKQDVSVPDPPQFLSQTGAFSNLANLTPRAGLIPYTVNTPLWSDGATKKRWIALPNDGAHDTSAEQITFSENGEWQFPSGTVFVKHFELPINEGNPSITARVETRFIVIDKDGGAYGVTYKWNDAGTDAELLTSGDSKTFTITRTNGTQYSQVWDYPSRTDCNTCHNANANFVLGVKTRQLNGDLTYPSGTTDNQLNTWQSLGMFSNGFTAGQIEGFPKMVALNDNSANLETRVRSYLDANCAHCHRPNGVEGIFDARFSTPISSQNLINTIGISRNTPEGNVIVKPKDPANSELWVRDNSLGENAMPPLAKNIIDDEYIDVLTDWINSLDESACSTTFLSDLSWEGTPTNGWGPVELDQSNGGTGSNDGSTLTINGTSFAKGLGAHAESEIIYNIGGGYETFKSFIGVDDATCSSGSVQFEVYTDGSLVYQSPVLTQADDGVPISVDVTGVNQLRLVVNDGGSGGNNPIACDHADWADAKLESCINTGCDDLGIFATTEDIGGVQAEGQACHENGFYTVTGSGADIWGTNDEFRYIYQAHTGDVEIIAKVNSVDNTNQWAKAGPMIRASNTSNAAMVLLLQRPDNQVGFQWRASTGASATWTGSLVGGTSTTKFLRLTRNGDVFNAYYSTSTSNGPWTQIGGDVNINMNAQALVGLAVTSHSDGNLCTATFEEVRLETCTLEPGSSCNDNDPCTINDVYDPDCNCAGTFQDSDQDGVCDQDDICPGHDDTVDSDSDGIPDGCDTCDNTLIGTSCDDGDACTINDVYDGDCNCVGTFQDSDADGVCDADDVCPGSDDTADADGDGTP